MSDDLKQPDLVSRLLAYSAVLANEEEDLVNEAAKRIADLEDERITELEAEVDAFRQREAVYVEQLDQRQERIAELEQELATLRDKYDGVERDYQNAIHAGVNVTIPKLEAQLSSKDEEIERLKAECKSAYTLSETMMDALVGRDAKQQKEIASLRKALERFNNYIANAQIVGRMDLPERLKAGVRLIDDLAAEQALKTSEDSK